MARLSNTSFAYSFSFQLFSAQALFWICLSIGKLPVDKLLKCRWELPSEHLTEHEPLQTVLPPQHSLSQSPSNLWCILGGPISFVGFWTCSLLALFGFLCIRTLWIASLCPWSLWQLRFVNLFHILPSCVFQAEESLMNLLQISVCNNGNCSVAWIPLSPIRTTAGVLATSLRKGPEPQQCSRREKTVSL